MGIFGGLRSLVSSAVNGAKKVVSVVVEKGKKAVAYVGEKINVIREKVSDTWAGFTGKKKADEAKKLYEEIERRYNEEKASYQEFKRKYSKSIKNHLENINLYREIIKSDLLPKFKKAISKLYQYPLPENFLVEEYKDNELVIEDLKAKEDVLTIDWGKNPLMNTIKAIFTLGIWTRGKADESWDKVNEQKLKMNENIAKMNTEKLRIERIDQALANAEYYFQKVTEYYEVMLVRIDNAINTLYVRCMAKLHKFVHQEMSFRRLTKVQIKELEAAFVASQCLKGMAEMQVLSQKDSEVEKYSVELKERYTTVENGYQAA